MFILILGLLFALLVAIFAIQNANPVAIQFLWIEAKVPLVLVILGSALAGALVTLLLALWREFRNKRKNQRTTQTATEKTGAEEIKESEHPLADKEVQ